MNTLLQKIFIIAIIFCLLGQNLAKDNPSGLVNRVSITKVETRNSIENDEPYGSINGGTTLYITAEGFSQDITANTIQVGNYDCVIPANGIVQNLISCVTDPAWESENRWYQEVVLWVEDEEKSVSNCPGGCYFHYTSGSTPVINYVQPNANVPGGVANWNGIWKVDTTADIKKLTIGEYNCNRYDLFGDVGQINLNDDEDIDSGDRISLACDIAPTQPAGKYTISAEIVPGTPTYLNQGTYYTADGSETYNYVIVAEIESLSESSGGTSGNRLKITGSGFGIDAEEAAVNVGDLACEVVEISNSEIICDLEEGATDAVDPAVEGQFIGGQGAKFTRYSASCADIWSAADFAANIDSISNSCILEDTIISAWEQVYDDDEILDLIWVRGYFKAPRSGDYDFLVSADDQVQVYFNSNSKTQERGDLILDRNSYTDNRIYWYPNSQDFKYQVSGLVAGELYWVELFNYNGGGSGHFALSVETPATADSENWTNTVPEIQTVKISPNKNNQRWKLKVYDNDEPIAFYFKYTDPSTMKVTLDSYTSSKTISSWTAESIVSNIDRASKYHGATLVESYALNASGEREDGATSGLEVIFDFTLYRTEGRLNQAPKCSNTKNCSFQKLQEQSDPVSGTYQLSFAGELLRVWANGGWTTNIPYSVYGSTIQGGFIDKYDNFDIEITRSGRVYDGALYTYTFRGYSGDLPLMEVVSNDLEGGESTPDIIVKEIVAGSNRPLYEPIPFDMSYVAADVPSVQVKINGIDSVCSGDCSYQTDAALTPAFSSFTETSNNLSIDLSANSLSGTETVTIWYGGYECTNVYLTNLSAVTCSVAGIQAGNNHPIVLIEGLGYATFTGSDVSTPLVVSSLSQSTGSVQGGITVTITGTGFPQSTENLSVQFGTSVATVKSTSNTQIEVLLPAAPGQADGAQSVQVTFNSITSNTDVQFTYSSAGIPTITSISPTTASPVQKSTVDIIGTDFGTDDSIVSVFLLDENDDIVYELNVLSVADTQISARLGGGHVGTYYLRVVLDGIGYSMNTAEFKYIIEISSISPSTGNQNGGTIITISGENFSNTIADNAVLLNNGATDLECEVISATTTELVVRTPANTLDADTIFQVIVQGRLMEESTCAQSADCTFTYTSTGMPTLNEVSDVKYDNGEGVYLTGSNFSTTDTVYVFIDGVQYSVNVDVYNDAEAKFYVPDDIESGEHQFTFSFDGVGHAGTWTAKVYYRMKTVSPTTFSTGGALITIGGSGFDQNSVVLIGTKKCAIVSIATNQIVCSAPPQEAGQYNLYLQRNYYDDLVFETKLTYSAGATTVISSSSSSDTLSGSSTYNYQYSGNFVSVPQEGYLELVEDATFRIQGTQISSGNFQFDNVPVGLYNIRISFGTNGYAEFDEGVTSQVSVEFDNVNINSGSTTGLNGGNTLVLASTTGFNSQDSSKNEVYVCGQLCEITDITASQLSCTLPKINTEYLSGEQPLDEDIADQVVYQGYDFYNQQQPINYFNKVTATNSQTDNLGTQLGFAYDNKEEGSTECYYKWETMSGSQLKLTYLQVIFDETINFTDLYYNLVLEGSNDDSTWSEIETFDAQTYTEYQEIRLGINSDPANNPVSHYKYLRLTETAGEREEAVCNFHFRVIGYMFYENQVTTNSDLTCAVNLRVNGVSQVLGSSVTYSGASTSYVDGISPKYGKIQGGESLTISGENFGTDSSVVQVLLDGVECAIDTINDTTITCTTGVKSGVHDPEISIYVNGNKSVVRAGAFFIYGLLWSDEDTWNGETAPRAGDSVQVPAGQVLILDESTPQIYTLIIQGGFYVADDVGDLTLDANYIVVRNGFFKIGDFNNPHTNSLTITLHGKKQDPQLPMFGNKCLVCHNCKFDIHGEQVTPTFTWLTASVSAGDNQITVEDAGNWQVGQLIAIATTDFYGDHSETATITNISGNVLTLDTQLQYGHLGVQETYGTKTLNLYAEVQNLSRNILIQGDSDSEADKYGGHIMIHGLQDKGARARITYTELTQMGQPAIMGRYNIHFHQLGIASNSYIIGNAVHNSNARLIAIHATNFLQVSWNVGYHNRGHNIFLEDGVETHNVIEHNCVIHPYSATNMLQTDITVAGIWVTNPTNYVRYNHISGSDFYGIWAEIKEEPESRTDMCPQGMKLLQIDHNIGHSNLRFGLRFFHLYPRTYPCQDTKNVTNPNMFEDNPSIQTVYNNQTSWKNGESGILAEFMGNAIFQDCIMADSYRAGFQLHTTNFTQEYVILQDSVIIGATANNGVSVPEYPASAILLPRTNGFLAKNIEVHNMVSGTHILESSSENDQVKLWVQGGYQAEVENIQLFNCNDADLLKWKGPLKNVVLDKDGSLTAAQTGQSVPTWIAPYYPYYDQLIADSECYQLDAKWENSVACTTMLRGYKFGDFDDGDYFIGQALKVFNVNDQSRTFGDVALTDADFGVLASDKIKNKPYKDFKDGYAAILPTGHVFNLHWNDGIDFDRMAIYGSYIAEASDDTTIFRFNYTEHRELFELYDRMGGANEFNQLYEQKSDLSEFIGPDGKANNSGCTNGDYYNDGENQFLYICINNKGRLSNYQQIDVSGIYCRDTCESAGFNCEKETTVRQWHYDSTSTMNDQYLSEDNGKAMVREPGTDEWIYSLPVSGWDFRIPCEWTVKFNVDNFEFNNLYIDGTLRIDDTIPETTITATNIWITGGKLVAGNEGGKLNAFKNKLNIVLKGTRESQQLLIDDIADSGTKSLVVTGQLELYGEYPSTYRTRLAAIAHAGDTEIFVIDDISEWSVGDELVLGANNVDGTGYEKVEIAGIDASLKKVTLASALQNWHYGHQYITVGHSANAETQIDSNFTELDMRTPVGHITRNIKIYGTDEDQWGGHLQIYHYINFEEETEVNVRGHAVLQGVELTNMGQHNSKAGIDILYTNRDYEGDIETTVISGSSIVDSYGIMVDGNNANYVTLDSNVLYRGEQFLIQALDGAQWTITDNLLIGAYNLQGDVADGAVWTPVAFIHMYTPYLPSVENHLVTGNVASGSEGIGYAFPGTPCEEASDNGFTNNESGYAAQNGMLYNMKENKCYNAGYIATYGSSEGITINEARSDFGNQIEKITAVENKKNIELHGASRNTFYVSTLTDTFVSPIVRTSCTECYDSDRVDFNTYCSWTRGIQLDVVTENGESFPWHKKPDIYDVICVEPIPFTSSVIQDTIGSNYKLSYDDYPECKSNYMFKNHPTAADATSGTYLTDVSCEDCDFEALVYIMDPLEDWEGWFGGCGDFVCTGIENVLIQDLSGSLFGDKQTVISNNQYIAKSQTFITENCQLQNSWNAYLCTNNDFTLLQWDAIGTDKQKQSPIPVYLQNDHYKNKLNMWREWEWQGSEPLNLRLNRFVGLTQINTWSNVTYSGTQSVDIIYKLANRVAEAEADRFVIIQSQYFISLAIEILINDKVVKPNSSYSPANLYEQKTVCGSNNYYYQNNTIQFVIVNDPDCVVEVKQVNQVYVNLRVKMTTQQFVDGQYNFEDKVSAYLGISYDKVRVVGIMNSRRRVLASGSSSETDIKVSVRGDVPGDKTTNYDAKQQYLVLKGHVEALQTGIDNEDSKLKELVITELSGYEINVLKETGEEDYVTEDDFKNGDDDESGEKSKSKVIGIALGIIFGLAFIIIVLMVVYHLYKKKQALKVQNLQTDRQQQYDKNLQISNKLSMQQSESKNQSEMFSSNSIIE